MRGPAEVEEIRKDLRSALPYLYPSQWKANCKELLHHIDTLQRELDNRPAIINSLRNQLIDQDAKLEAIKEGLLAIVKKHTGDMK